MGLLDFLRRGGDDEPRQKADRLVVDDDELELEDDDEDEDDDRFDEKSAPEDREDEGPFDVTEANPAKRYVDLGAIRIPAREGLGLRLEVEERSKRLVAVALDYKGSTMQVQAFAAPRSSGLWHPIRRQLAEQVEKQGGSAEEIEAALGPVLDTKLPLAKGATGGGHRSARFIGVDGPRWFLRGVLTGDALRSEEARDAMEGLFRSIVVVRGDEAMPPRELLPLVVPKAMADHMADANQPNAAANDPAGGTPNAPPATGDPSPEASGPDSKRPGPGRRARHDG